MKNTYYRHFLFLLLMLLSAHVGWSQGTTTAAMNGVITDKDGAGLPGATVIAVHTPTNTQYVAPTNSEGRFNIPNMRVGGPYTVRVTFVGYQDINREGIFLSLGQNLRLDLNLSETTTQLAGVTVTATQDPVINAGRTGAATTVRREQIERLPTISRSFQDFTRLTPQANGNSLSGRNGRFNNVQIDGASNNDLFGLGSSGAPGGQAGTNPISLDAIQEFQVVLAPYDVRQGRFSGGGINAVTRSGTNEFSGSAFAFGRNQNTAGKSPTPNAAGDRTKLDKFNDYQAGFRLGGPIVKDKLFFFVNGEITRRTAPLLFRTGSSTDIASNNSSDLLTFVSTEQLQDVSDKLRSYGYDAGAFGEINAETRSNKAFARLDWNISQNHQLTLRHNFVDASDDNISRSLTNFRFGNNGYQFLSKTNSTVAELKSRFGNRFANNLLVGYSTIRDSRTTVGDLFPSITITAGNGTIVAGSEFSSVANRLDQDILEITDNFNVFAGKHVLTFGTNNEIFRFDNLFVQSTQGRYDFPSIEAFLNNTVTGTGFRYRQNFALPGGKPTAKFGAAQFGAYVQDEYNILDNFRLTTGVRFDLPMYFDNPSYNRRVDSTFAVASELGGPAYDVKTNRLPKSRLQVSPRIGFNWDVLKDQSIQVRGGIGIFTGRPAYVWISNQYGNTGIDFASYDTNNSTVRPAAGLGLTNNYTVVRDQISSTPASAAKGSIAVTDKDFRNPQLMRTNLAVDYRLPGGIVATLEGIYSKTLNDVLPQDINLVNPTGVIQGDGRVTYPTGTTNGNSNRYRNGRDFNNVIYLTNTSKGYQYSITGELKKQVNTNLFASAAYTYGQSRDLYSGTSSTAVSIWEFNPHAGNPNNLPLSYSSYDLRHRVIASFSYRKEYADHFATTVSAFYNGQSGSPFSYSYYGGDINNDGGSFTSNSNDLIYIPRSQSEIVLVTDGPNDRRTVDQIWNELNTFIENDDYLKEHRGEYAARNGARTPWQHRIDVRLLQDIYTKIGDKSHTIQLSVDVINFGNLLNKDWGRDYSVANGNYGLLRYQGLENGTTGRPTFSYGANTNTAPTVAYQISQLASRWQAQFGVRYLF